MVKLSVSRLPANKVRKSLRWDAARVAMRLGPETSLHQLISKLKSIYGSIDEGGVSAC